MQVLPSGREVVQEVSQQQSFKTWHYWPRVLGQVEALVEDAEAGTFSQLQLTEKAVMAALSVTAMLIRKGPILALSPYPVGMTGDITHAYGAATHDLLMDVLEVRVCVGGVQRQLGLEGKHQTPELGIMNPRIELEIETWMLLV